MRVSEKDFRRAVRLFSLKWRRGYFDESQEREFEAELERLFELYHGMKSKKD